jgi:L-amino acid N-acyltransferase YncA
MTGGMKVRKMQERDREAVMRIFNHYAATSFATCPSGPLPPQFFTLLREGALSAVVLEDDGGVAGFGFL